MSETPATLTDNPSKPSGNAPPQSPETPQQIADDLGDFEDALGDPAWYYDSRESFFKVLRFFNILEPDRTVLSMTKIMLWGTTINSILVVYNAHDFASVAGSIGLNVAAMVKHESRRRTQVAEAQGTPQPTRKFGAIRRGVGRVRHFMADGE